MNSSASRSYDLLWLSLALLCILPIAFYLSITPHDYWYFVRIGKDIWQTGVIPTVDTLSYTLLISTASAEGVKVASHNESRVMVKQNGTWKVVHVHKSPAWQAPHIAE